MTDVSTVEEDGEVDEVVEEASKSETNDHEPSEVEKIAGRMGWTPQDQWKGDDSAWVDAATFLERGPVFLKKTLEKQDSELAALNKKIERMAKASEKAGARAYAKALTDLKAQRAEAIKAGDPRAVDHFDKELDELRKDEPEATDSTNPDEDPNFKSWLADNSWYGKGGDYKMRAFANQIAPEISADGYTGADFYVKVTELVRDEFPDKFGNKARKSPARVEGAGTTGMRGSAGKKTFNDLPPEAKEACKNYVADGVLTKEQYVADYFSEE